MSDNNSSGSSIPILPEDSPGSSISTRLQEEYDELLKYAVIIPSYDPNSLPKSLSDLRGSFPAPTHNELENTYDDSFETEGSATVTEDPDSSGSPQAFSTPARLTENTPIQYRQTTEAPVRQLPEHAEMTPLKVTLFPGEEASSPGSEASSHRSPEISAAYSPSVDQDVARMEHHLDQWSYDLKRNVLAEFTQSKIKLVELHRGQLIKEKEKHAAEINQLQNEIETLKELLHTYEQSIERKDQVISNLTHGMHKQKEKLEMAKTFCEWKIKHCEIKREEFAGAMAQKHYHRCLSQKTWDGWHSIVEAKWRQRVEKACQAKAQEVCMQLTNDYETRINSLNEALDAARTEVTRLHAERDRYEETMKKAFMRGVCALNLEAMTMFQGAEQDEQPPSGESNQQSPRDLDLHQAATYAQEAVFTSDPGAVPPARVVTSQNAARVTQSLQTKPATSTRAGTKTVASGKGKVISATISGRSQPNKGNAVSGLSGPTPLAPPMSSVIVERHQPVVKQTIGHATASKFPRTTTSSSSSQPGIVQRKIAGQVGGTALVTPNVQTVKVVD